MPVTIPELFEFAAVPSLRQIMAVAVELSTKLLLSFVDGCCVAPVKCAWCDVFVSVVRLFSTLLV